MSVEDVNLRDEDVEVDLDALEKQLEDLPEDDDEGTEVPEGEGKSDDEVEETEKESESTTDDDKPADPPPKPAEDEKSVPLGALQEQRRRNNDLQKQLAEANAKLAEASTKPAVEIDLKPLTDEEFQDIADELGETEAKRQQAQRQREIAIYEQSAAERNELRKELEALKQTKEVAQTRADMAGTPDLLKWFDDSKLEGEEGDTARDRLAMADAYMPAAERLHPNDIPAQNKFIQRRVNEDLGLKTSPPATEKKPASDVEEVDDVSISDMPGGQSAASDSLAEKATRIRSKDPSEWSDAEVSIIERYAASLE